MFDEDGYFMGGMHWIWWIFWLALVGAIVLYGWGRLDEPRRRPRETPLEVARRRLANGEIRPDEYEQRKALPDRDAAGKARNRRKSTALPQGP